MPRKRGRGRPKFKPTKATRQRVKTLVGMGTSVRDAARLIGVTAPTLRKHFALEIETAAAEATAAVLLAMFRAATDATRPNVRAARAWLEVARGLRRFEEYLAAHAMFSAWDERLQPD